MHASGQGGPVQKSCLCSFHPVAEEGTRSLQDWRACKCCSILQRRYLSQSHLMRIDSTPYLARPPTMSEEHPQVLPETHSRPSERHSLLRIWGAECPGL